MKYRRTTAIVLRRTDFGEADRILTALTPEGKFGLVAKGVRRLQSKLAAGIEPLSENELSVIEGKGELLTLTSARVIEVWGQLLHDYDRLQLANSFMKHIDRLTEPQTGGELYPLLHGALKALNQPQFSAELVELWFFLQLLGKSGHQPELRRDEAGEPLHEELAYHLEPTRGTLVVHEKGALRAEHIKLWRLCLQHSVEAVAKVGGSDQAALESIGDLRAFVDHTF